MTHRPLFPLRPFSALAIAAALVFAAAPALAHTTRVRTHGRTHAHLRTALHHEHLSLVASPVLAPGTMLATGTGDQAVETPVPGAPYSLRLHNLHTFESIDVVYRIGDTYIPGAVARLDSFLRDHNNDRVTSYDPAEFDLLHNVLARLGRSSSTIDVVCGYRSPETNEALRGSGPNTGVAEHSQHILGHAIDIRVPGVPTARLRSAALSLQAGGVGYYPRSQFVHVDVGPVREWTFAPVAHRRGHRRRRA